MTLQRPPYTVQFDEDASPGEDKHSKDEQKINVGVNKTFIQPSTKCVNTSQHVVMSYGFIGISVAFRSIIHKILCHKKQVPTD